jgi:hypothetical protein
MTLGIFLGAVAAPYAGHDERRVQIATDYSRGFCQPGEVCEPGRALVGLSRRSVPVISAAVAWWQARGRRDISEL